MSTIDSDTIVQTERTSSAQHEIVDTAAPVKVFSAYHVSHAENGAFLYWERCFH